MGKGIEFNYAAFHMAIITNKSINKCLSEMGLLKYKSTTVEVRKKRDKVVLGLHDKGYSVNEIARELHIHRQAVVKTLVRQEIK